ncbi:MAG: serine/threonine-protein kinase [Sorangiineae bacterium]|nr:serine/threonine-protein kinase [Sorangiineae bacterium]MEB2343311.1 serine/threonine-protein kinase [Deltaproteobacteria bacterium]
MTEDLRRGDRLGKYELLLRIGRGGMATVWVAREHAERREDDRLVALKVILADLAGDPEFTTMFLDEGRLVRSIGHPNVVDVYDVAEANGVMYMAMEWVEGDSLHAVIAEAGKRRPIPPEMAVRIIADAAAGLHAAHELKGPDGKILGVVHRDVSPHNILIGTDGAIKLVDFGVAKAMGRLTEATSAGQLKGKFGYMSPEQAMARPVDRRADVFALGIVLFELTTGRRLFRGEHDAETLHLVVSGEIPHPTRLDPEYPVKLEKIVLKALERDPALRYQTAAELEADLEAYLKEERIFVARAGIAGLLKRVLGTRIEQRRKAIRVAMKAIAGEGESTAGARSAESLLGPPGHEHASVTGLSGVSGVSGAGSWPSESGLSQPSAPQLADGSTGPHVAPVAPRRGGMLGYAVGIGGLVVALLVVLLVIMGTRRTTTQIVNVSSPGSEAVPTSAEPRANPAPVKPRDDAPAVSLDALDALDAGASKPVPTGAGVAPAPRPHSPVAPGPVKPSPAPAAPAAPGSLPRKNPYAN